MFDVIVDEILPTFAAAPLAKVVLRFPDYHFQVEDGFGELAAPALAGPLPDDLRRQLEELGAGTDEWIDVEQTMRDIDPGNVVDYLARVGVSIPPDGKALLSNMAWAAADRGASCYDAVRAAADRAVDQGWDPVYVADLAITLLDLDADRLGAELAALPGGRRAGWLTVLGAAAAKPTRTRLAARALADRLRP